MKSTSTTQTAPKATVPAPINIEPILKALETARQALNTAVDAEWKVKRVNGLRTLGLAENAIQLTEKHLAKAVKQTSPKAAGEASAE